MTVCCMLSVFFVKKKRVPFTNETSLLTQSESTPLIWCISWEINSVTFLHVISDICQKHVSGDIRDTCQLLTFWTVIYRSTQTISFSWTKLKFLNSVYAAAPQSFRFVLPIVWNKINFKSNTVWYLGFSRYFNHIYWVLLN